MELLDEKQRLANRDPAGQPPQTMPPPQDRGDGSEALVTDGFLLPSLGTPNEALPAYGEHHDQVQFSQPGFEAGAEVTGSSTIEYIG